MLPTSPRVCEAQRVMVSRLEWYRLLHAQDLGHAADFLRFFAVQEPMFEETDRPTAELMSLMYESFSEWWYRGIRLAMRASYLQQLEHRNRVISAGYPSSPQEFASWQYIVSSNCADPERRAENVRHPVWDVPAQDLAEVQRFSIAPRVRVMESLASQQAGLDEIRGRSLSSIQDEIETGKHYHAGPIITYAAEHGSFEETVPAWQPVTDAPVHIEPRTKKVIRRTTTHTTANKRPLSAGIPVQFPVKVRRES
jgi:hypothetical protein